MEKNIIREICKNLKWYDIIIVKLYSKLFYKAYRKGMLDCFTFFNK